MTDGTFLHADARCLPLSPESIDAIVTDPPYELGFMSKTWDASGVTYDRATWAEALRVAKPGAHLLAFGGTRTHHRLMVAVEDAGWEIRDVLMWLFGSGFPKSKNVAGAIDRGEGLPNRGHAIAHASHTRPITGEALPSGEDLPAYQGQTERSRQWEGWGTALKPAYEPIVLARKPLIGTVAQNVTAYGTGALNIDGTRIGGDEGRWPANLILDEEAGALLDAENDDGPSRFFYSSKAGRAEREAGLAGFAPERRSDGRTKDIENPRLRTDTRRNDHPTVKPIGLMRYLCLLITPPGGTVLDPFCGSGSTGMAALDAGFGFIGSDLDPHYLAIAKQRATYRHDFTAAPVVPATTSDQGRLF
jgi:site-specific DNA-methyltransferase (adenine-specific)